MTNAEARPLDQRTILATWWPLAASWLCMSLETPVVSAVLARLAGPELQLAAFGGLVYPLLLVIESPVIMLLAASTALSRDWHTYAQLRRYMLRMSVVLTALHVLLVFTPLWDLVARGLMGAPEEIIGPARVGLMVAIPWTWSIAYRRFNQGILIRYGGSRAIGMGTVLRLSTTTLVLWLGLMAARRGLDLGIPGVAMATAGIIVGVVTEVAFVHFRTAPVVARVFDRQRPPAEMLGIGKFLAFYVPLALTSLLSLAIQPIGSGALSRMPMAIPSLAGWPVVIGVIWVLRAGGTAYKEVVVAMLDRPDPLPALRRFTLSLTAATFALTLIFVGTPTASFWLRGASGLGEDLAALTQAAVLMAVLIPVLGVVQNWYVGILVYTRRTRPITESVVGFLVAAVVVLSVGVVWQRWPGLHVAIAAFNAGTIVQLTWVWWSARPWLREQAARQA